MTTIINEVNADFDRISSSRQIITRLGTISSRSMKHVISKLTVEGDTVPDCFMGSGTTGIAATNYIVKTD